METPKKGTCRKKQYQKVSFDMKLSIIDEIANGQISVNHAANKHNISRSSIEYWIKKLSNFEDRNKTMAITTSLKTIFLALKSLQNS